MDLFYLKASLTDTSLHILSIVHLRVAVGNNSEIEARHRQTESCRFKALTVPKCLHDRDARLRRHRRLRTLQNAHNLLHRETVEELTHPDGVETTLTLGEHSLRIEQVDAIATDALSTRLAFDILLHHTDLLRQVEDSHLHLIIITHTLQGPLARITTHIVERTHMVLVEYDLQGFRE